MQITDNLNLARIFWGNCGEVSELSLTRPKLTRTRLRTQIGNMTAVLSPRPLSVKSVPVLTGAETGAIRYEQIQTKSVW